MKKLFAGMAAAAMLIFSSMSALAATDSCSESLKSSLGESLCFEVLDSLAPGKYNVSFEYQAEKATGNLNRTLDFAFLFDSQNGPAKTAFLSDSTASSGWNTFSFLTQAQGDAFLAIALLGLYPQRFSLALQNIQVTAVPEPATYAMLLAGLGAILFVSRRRRP